MTWDICVLLIHFLGRQIDVQLTSYAANFVSSGIFLISARAQNLPWKVFEWAKLGLFTFQNNHALMWCMRDSFRPDVLPRNCPKILAMFCLDLLDLIDWEYVSFVQNLRTANFPTKWDNTPQTICPLPHPKCPMNI